MLIGFQAMQKAGWILSLVRHPSTLCEQFTPGKMRFTVRTSWLQAAKVLLKERSEAERLGEMLCTKMRVRAKTLFLVTVGASFHLPSNTWILLTLHTRKQTLKTLWLLEESTFLKQFFCTEKLFLNLILLFLKILAWWSFPLVHGENFMKDNHLQLGYIICIPTMGWNAFPSQVNG